MNYTTINTPTIYPYFILNGDKVIGSHLSDLIHESFVTGNRHTYNHCVAKTYLYHGGNINVVFSEDKSIKVSDVEGFNKLLTV